MATNEPGILLMRKSLQKYVGARPSLAPPFLLTPGFWLLTSALMTNEARILLMHKNLQEYVGNAAVIGSATASDSGLLAPDFCFGDERSQNVIDMQGHRNLYLRQTTKAGMIELASRLRVEVTVTTGKVPVTAAERVRIRWQAGMSNLMRDVRSYVGRYRWRVYVNTGDGEREGWEK